MLYYNHKGTRKEVNKMYVLEKYFTETQIKPHVEYFDTYEEAISAKEKFYSRKGYSYAEIIRRS